MATYVMGDIHGAYKAMIQCFQRSGFSYGTDTLIQLGDVADRGPQVFECVEELLKIKHLVAVKGNHDDWFMQYINTGLHPGSWSQGGKYTLMSYLQHTDRNGSGNFLNPGDVPDTHRAFFNNQLHYYISRENDCFVHAGFDRTIDFFEQQAMLYYWDRALWQDALFFEVERKRQKNSETPVVFPMKTTFREIYIGHTPTTKMGSDRPMRAMNVINLDTGAGQSGRLTIMDIETKVYWQSDPVAELYAGGAE